MKSFYKQVFIFFIGIFTITACSSDSVFVGSVSPVNNNWHKDSSFVFNARIDNIKIPYQINLGISNYNTYPYSNIWFFVKTIAPDGNSLTDTIEYFLCNKKGQWYGEKHGDIWTLNYIYKEKVGFAQKGEYTFEIRHGMRNEQLEGFRQLDFKIKKKK